MAKINLKDIKTIESVNALDRQKILQKTIEAARKISAGFLPNSGYTITVSGLTRGEMETLARTNMMGFEYRSLVIKLIYSHIIDTSLGKISFEDFLNVTLSSDLETICYLIYISTFTSSGRHSFDCDSCKQSQWVEVKNENIVQINAEKYEEKKKLYDNVKSIKELLETRKKDKDFLKEDEGVLLPVSKKIVVLKIPTLLESLKIYKSIPEDKMYQDDGFIYSVMYINNLLIPKFNGDNGEIEGYLPKEQGIIERVDINEEIEKVLSADDLLELGVSINDFVDSEPVISYKIKKIVCSEPDCGYVHEDRFISLEMLLFMSAFATTHLLKPKTV